MVILNFNDEGRWDTKDSFESYSKACLLDGSFEWKKNSVDDDEGIELLLLHVFSALSRWMQPPNFTKELVIPALLWIGRFVKQPLGFLSKSILF